MWDTAMGIGPSSMRFTRLVMWRIAGITGWCSICMSACVTVGVVVSSIVVRMLGSILWILAALV